MDKVELRNDPFNGASLTKENLQQAGLAPIQKVQINNTDVWLSKPYVLGHGRIAVIGYVEDNGKLVARSFYRSNSQGVWRYMPSYLASGGHLDWYGKGHSEESVTLPIALQKALSTMKQTPISVQNPEAIFAGTAKDIALRARRDPNISYIIDVQKEGTRLAGSFYKDAGKVPPEKITFTNPQEKPDFTKPIIAKWEQQTALYGRVTTEVIPSADGKFFYMFCRGTKGRAWIGGIEKDGNMTSHGIRENWIKGGDLTTPPDEYRSQTHGYGNNAKPNQKYGEYVDMFDNYLSKVPIIRDYLSTRQAT